MKRIEVPYIDQTQRYPTGCESISAVMLLGYLGYPMEPETFIDQYLPKKDLWFQDGVLYGPHPDQAFIGSPYNDERGSFGCYAPCIASALAPVVGDRYQVQVEKGRSLEHLCRAYIDRDMPVILWATLNMEPSSPGPVWRLADGEPFQWRSHQHCLLLVGYDESRYFFNDPWQNKGCIGYDKALADQRYRELGMQAVGLLTGKNAGMFCEKSHGEVSTL